MSRQTMTVTELMDAAHTLENVARYGEGWHPDHPQAASAVQMRLAMQLATLYLVDFAKGLKEGLSVDAAAEKMIKGDRKLSPEAAQEWDDHRRTSMN